MKYEWKKQEKNFYLPKNKPAIVDLPAFKFFTIKGAGNPNDDFFADYISVLYALSYAVKMSHKTGKQPLGYFEYAVYPLEGVWDISDEAKKNFTGKINKNDLVFDLMIRQPNFVTAEYADEIITATKKKKPHHLLDNVKFEILEEGLCLQCLHIGPYDDEPNTFKLMDEFANQNNFTRIDKTHREIYLSDARKTASDKLKTVLRYKIQ